MKRSCTFLLLLSGSFLLAGCGQHETPPSPSSGAPSLSEEVSSEEPISSEEIIETISIADAKKAEDGTEVTVRGLVTQILYKSDKSTISYVWLSDGAGICVYPDKDKPISATKGHYLTVKGTYTVYKGLPQIASPTILKDEEASSIPEEIVPSSFVKGEAFVSDVLALPVTPENVGDIYQIHARVRQGNYNAYYLDAFSGDETLLTYSASSYSEYSFLSDYIGKDVTVLSVLGNPKTSGNNLSWRVCPIAVLGEYEIDDKAKLAGIVNEPFQDVSTFLFAAGSQTLPAASNILEGAIFSYASNDESVATVTKNETDWTLSYDASKPFTITATLTLGEANLEVTQDFEVKTEVPTVTPDKIETLRSTGENGETIHLEAVVLGGVFDNGHTFDTRFNSYYVMDASGSIQITLTPEMAKSLILHKGEKVWVEGIWDIYAQAANSKKVINAKISYLESGEHPLPREIGTKTFQEMYDYTVDIDNNRAGDVFYMDCILKKLDTQNGTQYYVFGPETTDFETGTKKNIYHSTGADFSYLDSFVDKKLTVLMGVHDKKAVSSGEATTGGYYRYDLVSDCLTPIE